MAITQYTEVWFRPLSPAEGIRTAFEKVSTGALYPLDRLPDLLSKLDRRFEQFARGELNVHEILSRPDDLAVYALASVLHESSGGEISGLGAARYLPSPGQLGSRSSLPVGAGLGSSAAVVAATTVLFEQMTGMMKTEDARAQRVRFCERLKHGNAGPIDAATVVHGGLVTAQDGHIGTLTLHPDHPLHLGRNWHLVLHGLPECSTGDCVSQVRETHGGDTALWDQFAQCTRALSQALSTGENPNDALRENQRLLDHIGVVPEATRHLIDGLAQFGGVAKVCGAGAVTGEWGGAVLIHLEDDEAVAACRDRWSDLRWMPLRMARSGAATGVAPTGKSGGPNE
jgi:mevalonate kinase